MQGLQYSTAHTCFCTQTQNILYGQILLSKLVSIILNPANMCEKF